MRLSNLLTGLVGGQSLMMVSATNDEASTLGALARDLERVESVREIKDVQRTFSQLAQFGRFSEMAALFSDTGVLQWGNETVTTPAAIQSWLKTDAGDMDGIKPGSFDTIVAETPLVNLAIDGRTAKVRWNGMRFMGDGANNTRIQGGIYENEYALTDGRWKISLLHYYPLYSGDYARGWRTVNGKVGIIPYHYTEEETGLPISPPVGDALDTSITAEEFAHRISRLNDEDDIRNLQHAYGYYVDRRMWSDVVDLFIPNGSITIGSETYQGTAGIRKALEKMGPEGLTEGILNDYPHFDTIVTVSPYGMEAIARGIAIGLIGNTLNRTASWEFNVFRNHFVKDNGVWKFRGTEITNMMVADYKVGWGGGSLRPQPTIAPEFLDITTRRTTKLGTDGSNSTVADLQRRLARSAAYDGTENVSHAYGYYLDDLRCEMVANLHANNGNKASPFAGWYQTRARIAEACRVVYGNKTDPAPERTGISFHWRPQPVILVSHDGRSASLRARLFQPATSNSSASGLNGAIYHDQTALEEGKWKLWSITIDEHYFTSNNWAGGWWNATKRNTSEPSPPPSSGLTTKYPPDVSLIDLGDREAGFRGGLGRTINWPEIQHMWFSYRNPVSGKVPELYWSSCVPCQIKPAMGLRANGYQEPPTGPTNISAMYAPVSSGGPAYLAIVVAGGPGEEAAGTVQVRESDIVLGSAVVNSGVATVSLPASFTVGMHILSVVYPGSESLRPAQTTITVKVEAPL